MPTAQGTGSALAFRREVRTRTVSNKALSSNVATLTTSAAHNFVAGESVTVSGVDATFNGTFTIVATPTSTTFTYAKTAADVGSTSATGTAVAGSYGTHVAADRAVPMLGETLTKPKPVIEAPTLRGGNILDTSSSYRFGPGAGGGDTNLYLFASGAAFLWEAMLGSLVTTGAGPYTHTATPASSLPSYSIDVNIGGTAASDIQKQIDGAKVASWELGCAVGENVTLGITWAYQDEVLTTGAFGGSYGSAMRPYIFSEVVLSGSGAPAGCVQNLTISGDNSLLTDQLCLGSSSITEPVRNGNMQITGSMDVLLTAGSNANYSVFTTGTEVALIATMTSAVTASATCTITMNVRIEGTTPTVPDAGVITVPIPFKVIASSTDASGFTAAIVNGDAVA